MRGRFKSEGGPFTLSTAVHPGDQKATDESTDAYDSIDWLVKHVAQNNGKVGMWGVSYPGFAAAVALVNPHPALKAVSPQAAWIDYWMNDDLHRYGAMRLTYATDWVSSLQVDKRQQGFPLRRVRHLQLVPPRRIARRHRSQVFQGEGAALSGDDRSSRL